MDILATALPALADAWADYAQSAAFAQLSARVPQAAIVHMPADVASAIHGTELPPFCTLSAPQSSGQPPATT